MAENGGFTTDPTVMRLLFPANAIVGGAKTLQQLANNNFNDTVDSSTYTYRIEDVQIGRQVTIRRLIVQYRDLGTATVTFSITGSNDNGAVITANPTPNPTVLGGLADGNIKTVLLDIEFTGFSPQLQWQRAANGGQVSIISITMVGEVEEVAL